MIFLMGMEGSGSFVIKIFPDEESVAQAAAQLFVEQYKKSMARSDRFSVALSGGHTPLRTYELLSQEPFKSRIDWSHVHVFWGDERCVPISDSRSNYGIANKTLLSHVPIPSEQVHPILGTEDPHKSAAEYESVLKEYFGDSSPFFDLVFLGLGKDGHTASLFPGSPSLNEKVRWVAWQKNFTEDFLRITMTPQLLNLAQMVLFLVTGPEKAEILKVVLNNVEPTHLLPAQLIHPIEGEIVWLVDSSAHSFPEKDSSPIRLD